MTSRLLHVWNVPSLGRNVERLLGRDVELKLDVDELFSKLRKCFHVPRFTQAFFIEDKEHLALVVLEVVHQPKHRNDIQVSTAPLKVVQHDQSSFDDFLQHCPGNLSEHT